MKFDAAAVSKKDFMSSSGEFMMNMETYTSDFGLRMSIQDPDINYVRMQIESELKMDNIDPENVRGLVGDGERLYKRDEEKLKALLRLMIDDKFKI